MQSYCRKILVVAVETLIATTGLLVTAQEQTLILEEIVVTANIREQNLQDVPISVTAVTGLKMAEAGINNLDTGAAIAGGSEELHGTALIERGLRTRIL